ncbi:GNAT family N-acetyltransferase [Pedosphaera parvula]|uniref:GCN5-related N-acetyltransferase n=1 Tax=Pedosphaera parvula (strain Ellin514) TaxID=320771 RepID=B9XLS0_PEDPL|nr:GNAT family protein [Pedosphaera parvula]EEF59177.1 GCN5-related N-acetyltransferase [Pedosphaera parvula Ellin514]
MKKHVECPPGVRQHHEQMLRLVAKSFYNELINYGVNETEILSVAGHLLDNVIQKSAPSTKQADYYNSHFTLKNVQDEWLTASRLSVQEVSIAPMGLEAIPQILSWLQAPDIQQSFYPKFPESEKELIQYFQNPNREYFSILYKNELAGIMGAENIDGDALKLEMRKLVGDARMHGKGIGKRATFLFLYNVFEIRKFQKVYLHSLDINIRNINLNGKFGFELEGVFLEDAMVANRKRDVVRMALTGQRWLQIFA